MLIAAASDHDPFDLVEGNVVAAPVVEAGGAGRLVVGHLLGDFELAAVLEIGGNAGGAEGVAADLRLDPGRQRPPSNHPPHIGLQHGPVGQLAAAPLARAEERPLAVLADAGGGDVLLQIAIQIVMGGHLVFLAAFFVKPHPAAPPLDEEILDAHTDHRTHAGEGVDHQANQCAVAQTGQGSGVDGVEQRPRLLRGKHRRLALLLRVLRTAHTVRGIQRNHLADDHPIEEHPQSGQPQLHGRPGMLPELVFNEGRDVDRLDLGKILDADAGAEGGELANRFEIRSTGVFIADMGAEEVSHPFSGLGLGREDGGQGWGLDLNSSARHGSIIRMIMSFIMRIKREIMGQTYPLWPIARMDKTENKKRKRHAQS